MKLIRSLGPLALAAALLAACGGGDPYVPGSQSPTGGPTTPGSFTALVSFGDSLSDIGTYTPATAIPNTTPTAYFGGRFTTNLNDLGTLAATGKVWVENLATALSTATAPIIVTPAQVGFGTQSVDCPAAANPALAGTCTGYSQGGARVTNPDGIGKSSGFLTVPVKTQIANHLARFGSFKDSDLVIVFAGHNDAFQQLTDFSDAVTASQTRAQADVLAGLITPAQAETRVQQEVFAAQQVAQGAMKAAALELAGYVRADILANGGKYVAVIGMVDLTTTPRFASADANTQVVVKGLGDVFNLWLREGLSGAAVRWIDPNPVLRAWIADPAAYGLTNTSTPACDVDKISTLTGGLVDDGTSLFCNGTTGAPFNTLVTDADVSSWLFADTVHPSTKGHQLFSDALVEQLRAAHWIN